MISLPSLLAALVAILQVHPICENVAVMETRSFSSDQFFLKIRAELTGEYRLQVRIYYNQRHIDYADRLFTDVPLLRWDNKEEFRHLVTYQHHYHDDQGNVKRSSLSGDPESDMQTVLQEVSAFVAEKQASG